MDVEVRFKIVERGVVGNESTFNLTVRHLSLKYEKIHLLNIVPRVGEKEKKKSDWNDIPY